MGGSKIPTNLEVRPSISFNASKLSTPSNKQPPPPMPKNYELEQRMIQQDRRGISLDQKNPNSSHDNEVLKNSYSSLANVDERSTTSGGVAPITMDGQDGHIMEQHCQTTFRRPSHENENLGGNAGHSSSNFDEFAFRGDNPDDFRRVDQPFRIRDGNDLRREACFRGPDSSAGRGTEGFARFGRNRRGSDLREPGVPPPPPPPPPPPHLPFVRGGRGGRGTIPARGPNAGRGGPGLSPIAGRIPLGQNQIRPGRGEPLTGLRGPEVDSYYGPPGPINQEFRRSPPARGRFGGRADRGGPGRGPFAMSRNISGGSIDRFGVLADHGPDVVRPFDVNSEEIGNKPSFASMADRPSFQQDRSSFRSNQSPMLSAEGDKSDPFGRTRDRPTGRAPQTSPTSPFHRKSVATVALGDDNTPAVRKTVAATNEDEDVLNTKNREMGDENERCQSPLRTNALGEQSMKRAESAIMVLREQIKNSTVSKTEGRPSQLPTKQSLFQAMALIDQTIKQTQDLIGKKQELLELERKYEEKKEEEKAAEESRRKEEEFLARVRERERSEERAKELELDNLKQQLEAKLKKKREDMMTTLEAELSSMQAKEKANMSNKMNQQFLLASESFNEHLQLARESFDQCTRAAS